MSTNNNYIYKSECPRLVISGVNDSLSLIIPETKKYDLKSGVDFSLNVSDEQLTKGGKDGLYFFLDGVEIGFIPISGKVLKDGRPCDKQDEKFKEIMEKYRNLKKSDIPDPASK
jgi:hypothetical protein